MKSIGRGFFRWYQTHGERFREIALLGSVFAGLCLLIVVVDPGPWVARQMAAYAYLRLGALLLCGIAAVPLLAIYAWLRGREADSLMAGAETDQLTGVHNRRHIEELLEQEFDRALRYGRPLAMVMFDVDHLNQINAAHGTAGGDAVLASIVRRVLRRMRGTDHLGRWAGGSFLLICPETSIEGAARIADRMRRTVKQQPVGAIGCVVTASFGISGYYGQGDYEVLVDEAEHYVRVAKAQGRDRVMSRAIAMAQTDAGLAPEQPMLARTPLTTQLSTLMDTIVAPIRRRKRRER